MLKVYVSVCPGVCTRVCVFNERCYVYGPLHSWEKHLKRWHQYMLYTWYKRNWPLPLSGERANKICEILNM